MATQNPIESEGTYPLPEAQVDRFMMKVLVDYPTGPEEHAVVGRALQPPPATQHIITPEDLLAMQGQVDQVYVDPSITTYAVTLVGATRKPATVGLGELSGYVTYGGSPRASINLVLGARALAFLRGRDYVLPGDVAELAPDVLRHRLVLSYQALAANVDPDAIIAAVLRATPAPEVATRPNALAPGGYRPDDAVWQPHTPGGFPGQ
jgi:MoxR-like ATPase